jgi:hypothetical protein
MVGEIGGGGLGFESFLLIFSHTFHNDFVFGYLLSFEEDYCSRLQSSL